MNTLLSIFAIVISILAIVITQWITFLPGLGIGFQYHRRKAQIVIALIANLTALGLFLVNPSAGQLLVLAKFQEFFFQLLKGFSLFRSDQ